MNLRCVAGVWSGFDPDWLAARIRAPRWPWSRLLAAISARYWVTGSAEWQAIKRRVARIRREPVT